MPRYTWIVRGVCSAALGLAPWGPLAPARGSDVSGRVVMTDLCSPSVSPAVVFLSTRDATRAGQTPSSPATGPGGQAAPVIRQDGIRFLPRIQAIALGQRVRFENLDGEAHRVLIREPAAGGSDGLIPGPAGEFLPPRPGVLQLECGLHLHKRGFLIVSTTPWVQVCSAQGDYRLGAVPAGRYVLTAWHEMGEPRHVEIEVREGQSLVVPRIDLAGSLSLGTLVRKDIQLTTPVTAPVRPWIEPLDQISVLLTAACNLVEPPADLRKAQRLVEDAYWGEFEASDLESAIRINLGNARASTLAVRFGDFRRALRDVADRRREPSALSELTRRLLFGLGDAVRELDARGLVDNRPIAESRTAAGNASPSRRPSTESRAFALQALKRALHRVQFHADRMVPEDAAAALVSVIGSTLPPLRDDLLVRRPWSAWRLDRQFNVLEGELATGLRGDELADRFEQVASEIEAAHAVVQATPAGAMVPPFVALLIAVLASGLLAALMVPMAMVAARRGPPEGSPDAPARQAANTAARRALVLAAVAGLATGACFRSLAGEAGSGTLQLLDAWSSLVLCGLVFAGARSVAVLARSPSTRGAPALLRAGCLALFMATFDAAAAFEAHLAAAGSPTERLAAVGGGVVGVGLLGCVVWLVRQTPRRLGRVAWCSVAALVLFAAAVALGGTGVFGLQNAGVIGVTPLPWRSPEIPLPGLYPGFEVLALEVVVLVAALVCGVRTLRRAESIQEPSGSAATPRLRREADELAGPSVSPVGAESYSGPGLP